MIDPWLMDGFCLQNGSGPMGLYPWVVYKFSSAPYLKKAWKQSSKLHGGKKHSKLWGNSMLCSDELYTVILTMDVFGITRSKESTCVKDEVWLGSLSLPPLSHSSDLNTRNAAQSVVLKSTQWAKGTEH